MRLKSALQPYGWLILEPKLKIPSAEMLTAQAKLTQATLTVTAKPIAWSLRKAD
jgi:hypothetical protein